MEGWVAWGWAALDRQVMPEDQEPGALVGVRALGFDPSLPLAATSQACDCPSVPWRRCPRGVQVTGV